LGPAWESAQEGWRIATMRQRVGGSNAGTRECGALGYDTRFTLERGHFVLKEELQKHEEEKGGKDYHKTRRTQTGEFWGDQEEGWVFYQTTAISKKKMKIGKRSIGILGRPEWGIFSTSRSGSLSLVLVTRLREVKEARIEISRKSTGESGKTGSHVILKDRGRPNSQGET